MAQNPQKLPKRRIRGVSRYKRSETARLLKGVVDAGHTVRGLEIDPATGVLRVLVGKPDSAAGGNELDQWMTNKK